MSTPSVLFVCVRNGGNSQMAAGLMRKAAGDRVDVHSAGTQPGENINALSAQVLAEVGVDITGETPRPINPDLLRRVDLVVTLGRDATVEVPDGVELQNWDTDEPSERGIDGIERMRTPASKPSPGSSVPETSGRLSPLRCRSGHTDRTRVAYGSAEMDAEAHVGRDDIVEELRRVQADFYQLGSTTTREGLRRRSNGTRWSNQQLLYHMVFGYVVVRTLLPLVHTLGRLGRSRGFAATLNAGHRPFHLINYLGSCGGGQLLTTRAQAALLDRTIDALQRKLAAETDESLTLSMHFPTAWDPYFKPTMSVLDVYHFATQHYDHHRRQLDI